MVWLDKYLFKTYKPENEAFNTESPLAYAIKKAGAKNENGIFGEKVNGKIIPETVKSGDKTIGRFEVTRKQYSEFFPDYRYTSGTDNYPVNNISFENAAEYCQKLSELTGKTLRIRRI